MPRLVEFPIEGGGSLIVETEAEEPSGPRPAGGGLEQATQDLNTAVGKVRPLAEALLSELKELSAKPSEVAVEFGIKFSVEASVIVAKTAVEGNCTITLNGLKRAA